MANTKLREYISANFVNVSALARSMGVTRQSLTAKIDGKVNFTQTDLLLIKDRLHLSDDVFVDLFFDSDVEKLSTKEVNT